MNPPADSLAAMSPASSALESGPDGGMVDRAPRLNTETAAIRTMKAIRTITAIFVRRVMHVIVTGRAGGSHRGEPSLAQCIRSCPPQCGIQTPLEELLGFQLERPSSLRDHLADTPPATWPTPPRSLGRKSDGHLAESAAATTGWAQRRAAPRIWSRRIGRVAADHAARRSSVHPWWTPGETTESGPRFAARILS